MFTDVIKQIFGLVYFLGLSHEVATRLGAVSIDRGPGTGLIQTRDCFITVRCATIEKPRLLSRMKRYGLLQHRYDVLLYRD